MRAISQPQFSMVGRGPLDRQAGDGRRYHRPMVSIRGRRGSSGRIAGAIAGLLLLWCGCSTLGADPFGDTAIEDTGVYDGRVDAHVADARPGAPDAGADAGTPDAGIADAAAPAD